MQKEWKKIEKITLSKPKCEYSNSYYNSLINRTNKTCSKVIKEIYDVKLKLEDYIETLESISSFCNKYDLKISNVSNALNGKYKILNYYISDIFYEKFPIKITKDFSQKIIYQYDLQGNYIRSFDSQVEASKYLNKTLSIARAIRLGIETGGFQWSFEKVDKMKELVSKTKAKKVGKYTINGDLIKIFNTVREAKKDTSGAPNVLSGNRKTAGGYVWKYIED